MNLFINSALMWFLFAIIAIINGSIRNFVYGKYMKELRAHQISSIIFTLLIFIFTGVFLKIQGREFSILSLILIGSGWLIGTILFEFIFGHYVMKHPWEKLLHDYNIFKGRLWALTLVANLIAPLLMGYVLGLLI